MAMEVLQHVPTSAAYEARPFARAVRPTQLRWQQSIGKVCFSRVTELMTRLIILERPTGEHLRQELAAMDDLLRVLITLERILRRRQVDCAQGIPSVNKAISPGLRIVELVLQQLEAAMVILRRSGG